MCFAGRFKAIIFLLVTTAVMAFPACSGLESLPLSPAPQPATPSVKATPTPPPPFKLTLTPTPSPTLSGPNLELKQFMVERINEDRKKKGLNPVTLAANAAAQIHADDILANYYLSHWGTDGMKPYMRYTLEGGINYETENSAYSGWVNRAQDNNPHTAIDAKQEIDTFEYKMVNEDAASNWGHREAILNPLHKKVSIGLAYDKYRLALVQQFEGDYVQFAQLPTLSGNILSMSGKISLGKIDTFALFYDPLPQPKTPQELISGPRSYGMGQRVGHIISPPPPGQYYSSLSPGAIQATKWEMDPSGTEFFVQADISPAMTAGKGVYTVVIWVKTDTEQRGLTNYSLFVK